jgi:hypothetical protein
LPSKKQVKCPCRLNGVNYHSDCHSDSEFIYLSPNGTDASRETIHPRNQPVAIDRVDAGQKPPMPGADMLHKSQWEWQHEAQAEGVWREAGIQPFFWRVTISHRTEMPGLHHSCACWRQVEPRNLELISQLMPDSSTHSRRVPHYHPMLAEIWTDPTDELAGQGNLYEFAARDPKLTIPAADK